MPDLLTFIHMLRYYRTNSHLCLYDVPSIYLTVSRRALYNVVEINASLTGWLFCCLSLPGACQFQYPHMVMLYWSRAVTI